MAISKARKEELVAQYKDLIEQSDAIFLAEYGGMSVKDMQDLREIGLEELLSDVEAIIAVEWPKNTLATWIPEDARTWRVAITTGDDDARRIEITPPNS